MLEIDSAAGIGPDSGCQFVAAGGWFDQNCYVRDLRLAAEERESGSRVVETTGELALGGMEGSLTRRG